MVLTDQLFDSNGNSVEASSTYTLVKQDISEKPLGSSSQLQLQGLSIVLKMLLLAVVLIKQVLFIRWP